MGNDPSTNWSAEDIGDQQRELVDHQLAAMREGQAPAHFESFGETLQWLRSRTGLESVSLVDMGCASGYYCEIADHYVPGWVRWTGMDFNAHMINLARNHYPKARWSLQDLRTLGGISPQSYQIVLSSAVLMHIREWETTLESFARIAQSWLLLHRTWVRTDGGPTKIEVHQTYGHCAWFITFSLDELHELLKPLGFEEIRNESSGEKLGPDSTVRTLLFERSI